ncbi:MAG: hypothetical protein ACI9YH_004359, partial [Colwellia sp.]
FKFTASDNPLRAKLKLLNLCCHRTSKDIYNL